ncbi:hypothetical protein GCM10027346_04130 [Hymenobacter seoulensis]
MITYNHASFISQAIDSVILQKTSFNIEIIIGEDKSTDNTMSIIESYQTKHPDLIKIITSETNVGMGLNFQRAFAACSGEYIAWLEGDDYWTDPDKLQRQVDFLDSHSDFSICFHNMQVIYEDSSKPSHLSNLASQKHETNIEDLAKLGNYIPSASCVFRRNLVNVFPENFSSSPAIDYYLHMLNAKHGKIKYLPNVMGTYRIHKDGAWGQKPLGIQMLGLFQTLSLIITQMDNNIQSKMYKNLFNIFFVIMDSQDLSTEQRSDFFIKNESAIIDMLRFNRIHYDKALFDSASMEYHIGRTLLKPFRKALNLLRQLY